MSYSVKPNLSVAVVRTLACELSTNPQWLCKRQEVLAAPCSLTVTCITVTRVRDGLNAHVRGCVPLDVRTMQYIGTAYDYVPCGCAVKP